MEARNSMVVIAVYAALLIGAAAGIQRALWVGLGMKRCLVVALGVSLILVGVLEALGPRKCPDEHTCTTHGEDLGQLEIAFFIGGPIMAWWLVSALTCVAALAQPVRRCLDRIWPEKK